MQYGPYGVNILFRHSKQSEAKRLACDTSGGAFAMPSGNSVWEQVNTAIAVKCIMQSMSMVLFSMVCCRYADKHVHIYFCFDLMFP